MQLNLSQYFNVVCTTDDESDPEASELDLGTKIKTPKDVMLEELSLLNNKGSKMFKKRQQRVEKFIVENNVGGAYSGDVAGCRCESPQVQLTRLLPSSFFFSSTWRT